jgi:hypothetical protein
MTDKSEELQAIGRTAYESLAEMVAALNCDYARLEELRTDLYALETDTERAAWNAENGEELRELEDAAGDCKSDDEARERIQEDALSIEVRSDWTTPGETMKAEEFCILLSTGGPATRIRGELDEHGEPQRAWLEAQDWFQPWTQFFGADQATLLAYARCFYFGE